jgi:Rrf2 family protein
MKLTNRSEYGLLALVALVEGYPDTLVSGADLARKQLIPHRFLQQILVALRQGGFIRTVKGKGGGYALARPPEEITLAEVVRFFEGPLAPSTSVSENFYHPSPIEHEPGLVRVFREIRNKVAEILEQSTLAEVAATPKRRAARTSRRG